MENIYDALELLDLLIEEAEKSLDSSIELGLVRVLTNVRKRIEPEVDSV